MSDSTSGETQTPPPRRGLAEAINHMTLQKIESLLWITRMCTVVFTLLYLIPLFGLNPYTCYQRALISNAATSALRLHQRMPNVQLSRQFLALLLIEDSCHYLFFSLIFLFTYPMTLVLLPIFLFAFLHSAGFSLQILEKLGSSSGWLDRTLKSVVENHQRNILRLIAFTEIFLMPLTVFSIFSGRGSLLTPFVYYRFLSLRYASRRNPYTRTVFHEVRLTAEVYVNRPGCPDVIRRFVNKMITVFSSLAPPVPQ